MFKVKLRRSLPSVGRFGAQANDGETFLREVDEELRKEQMSNFVNRYGWWIVAAVVLVSGGRRLAWWGRAQPGRRGRESQTLIEALDAIEAGNGGRRAERSPRSPAATSSGPRRRVFSRANAEARPANRRRRAATLSGIAANRRFRNIPPPRATSA